jgi:hypothetical protein
MTSDFLATTLLFPEPELAKACLNDVGRIFVTPVEDPGEDTLSLVSLSVDDISERLGCMDCLSKTTLSVALCVVDGDRDDGPRNGTRDREDVANAEVDPVSLDEEVTTRLGGAEMSVGTGAEGSALLDKGAADGVSDVFDGTLPAPPPFVIVSIKSVFCAMLGDSNPDGATSELATVVDADPT